MKIASICFLVFQYIFYDLNITFMFPRFDRKGFMLINLQNDHNKDKNNFNVKIDLVMWFTKLAESSVSLLLIK